MNLENIPNGLISGLSTDVLDFVTHESNDRYMIELDQSFLDNLLTTEDLDKSLSPDQEKMLIELEQSGQATSSENQTKKWVKEFKTYLKNKGLCERFENVPPTVLNDYLRLFYSTLMKKDGSLYAPSSLVCIRAAIHRFLVSPEVNSSLNILQDGTFRRANGVLKAMVKKYLISNQTDKTNQFERITDSDLLKIRKYFSDNNGDSKTLQEECIFNIMLQFQLRGRENLRGLTKDTFEFALYEDNREYAFIKVPLLQKNVKASLNRKEFENLKEAKMASQKDGRCPVATLKKYLDLLPETKNNALFPGIKKDGTFSTLVVLGKDNLGNFMSQVSEKVKLSKRYTNHCLRVTGINKMHDSGLSVEEIASVTGHKHSGSVQRYIRRDARKQIKASDILSGSMEKTSDEQPPCSSNNIVDFHLSEAPCSSNNIVGFQLSETHKMTISRTSVDKSEMDKSPNGKKARLHTSWGLLEIDL